MATSFSSQQTSGNALRHCDEILNGYVTLSSVLSNQLIDESAAKYLVGNSSKMANLTAGDYSYYYGNGLTKLFKNVPDVLNLSSYFFANPSEVVEDIRENFLKDITQYASSEHMVVSSQDDIAYYDGMSGMMSNAFIPITNVRLTKFDVLSTDRNGKFRKASISGYFLLNPEAIDNDEQTAGIRQNRNAETNGSITSYAKLLESLNDKSEITNTVCYKPIPLEPTDNGWPIVASLVNGELVLTSYQNQLSAKTIDNFLSAYLSAANFLGKTKVANFKDPRVEEEYRVTYHTGYGSEEYQPATIASNLIPAYDDYSVSAYADVFADNGILYNAIRYLNDSGWKDDDENVYSPDETIVIEKNLDLYPTKSTKLSVNYHEFTEGGQISTYVNSIYKPFVVKPYLFQNSQASTFDCWTVGSTNEYRPNASFTPTVDNVDFYPKFVKKVTITYNRNGYSNFLVPSTNAFTKVQGSQYKILGIGNPNANLTGCSLKYADVGAETAMAQFFKGFSKQKSGDSVVKTNSTQTANSNTTWYAVFESGQSWSVTCDSENYFGLPYDSLSKTYGSVSVPSGCDWNPNKIKWPPTIKLNLADSNRFGQAYSYIKQIKLKVGGYINEIAHTHQCKLLANFYNYDGDSPKKADLMNPKPITLWSYSNEESKKADAYHTDYPNKPVKYHSFGNLAQGVTIGAFETIPKTTAWFREDGVNYKYFGKQKLSVQLIVEESTTTLKASDGDKSDDPNWTGKRWVGCYGYVAITSISARFN